WRPASARTSPSWWPTPAGSTCPPAPTPRTWPRPNGPWRGSSGPDRHRAGARLLADLRSATPAPGTPRRRETVRGTTARRVTGAIIEFYIQLEINKGGKLDDRLKLRGTTPRTAGSGLCPTKPARVTRAGACCSLISD